MNLTRRQTLGMGAGLLLGSAARHADAQDYPNKPIHVVVPSPPGTGLDVDSRFFVSRLSTLLGQPFIIDNKPGASGTIGTEFAAKAAPDGYTLFMGATSTIYIPQLYTKLNYKLSDFTAVSQLASLRVALVANGSVPVKTASELVALSKAKPGTIRAATQGVGSFTHLVGEWFVATTGASIEFIPYNTSNAFASLLSGETQLVFNALPPSMVGNVTAGKLKLLGTSGNSRQSALPDVPTFREAGMTGFEPSAWFGLLAPAATPAAVTERVAAACAQLVKMPDVLERYKGMGSEPVGSSPAEFNAFIKSERDIWASVVQRSGLKLD